MSFDKKVSIHNVIRSYQIDKHGKDLVFASNVWIFGDAVNQGFLTGGAWKHFEVGHKPIRKAS